MVTLLTTSPCVSSLTTGSSIALLAFAWVFSVASSGRKVEKIFQLYWPTLKARLPVVALIVHYQEQRRP